MAEEDLLGMLTIDREALADVFPGETGEVSAGPAPELVDHATDLAQSAHGDLELDVGVIEMTVDEPPAEQQAAAIHVQTTNSTAAAPAITSEERIGSSKERPYYKVTTKNTRGKKGRCTPDCGRYGCRHCRLTKRPLCEKVSSGTCMASSAQARFCAKRFGDDAIKCVDGIYVQTLHPTCSTCKSPSKVSTKRTGSPSSQSLACPSVLTAETPTEKRVLEAPTDGSELGSKSRRRLPEAPPGVEPLSPAHVAHTIYEEGNGSPQFHQVAQRIKEEGISAETIRQYYRNFSLPSSHAGEDGELWEWLDGVVPRDRFHYMTRTAVDNVFRRFAHDAAVTRVAEAGFFFRSMEIC